MTTEIIQRRATLKGFWLRLSIYVLPFAMGFIVLTGALIYTGESMPIWLVLNHQYAADDYQVIWRPRYGNRDLQFKVTALNQQQPEIIVIGSSRVLQVRRGFFNRQPDAFYNAAGPAWEADEVYWVLTHIDESALPDVVIFAIDPPWFIDSYEGDAIPLPVSEFSNIFTVNRAFLQDIINQADFDRPVMAGEENRFDFEQYKTRLERGSGGLALGLRAIRDGQGFRIDGSEQFGDYVVAGWLWHVQQRERHLSLMLNGEYMYPYGNSVSPTTTQRIRDVLDFALAHDIQVIGVMPPYEPQLWQAMLQTGNHDYVPQVTTTMQELFTEYDYPLLDYSDGASFGAVSEDYFDGWHPSERATLQMYMDMMTRVPELSTYSDYDGLQQILDNAHNTWQVFLP